MSKKTVTQTKPVSGTTQPPAKNQPKASPKEASKVTTKSSFDPGHWLRLGHSEETVHEIKTAFDLFDTDQGGSIDTKGK